MSAPKKFSMHLSSTREVVSFHANSKMISALNQFVCDGKTGPNGVQNIEIVTAVYEQGQKDGRNQIKELLDPIIGQLDQIRLKASYRPPGRPKKQGKKST
jgi:hypothetical protein